MTISRFHPASRKNVDRTNDPYIPRKGAPEAGICPDCRAINRKKRWYVDPEEYALLKRSGAPLRRCPACRKIADAFPSGVLTLRGRFLTTHRREILTVARNEEKRARGINPLERDDGMEILTTDEKLAQRIGREIRKAFRGTLDYKWSEDANLLRLTWERDA